MGNETEPAGTFGPTGWVGDGLYEAEVAVTTHGVVHITATDWGSLGYAQGWACASDHLPVIADQIVKSNGRRARFHGEGALGAHVASDFGYRMLALSEKAEELRNAQSEDVGSLVAGYVAGYNRAVDEYDRSALPEWCGSGEWIAPIDELEFYAHLWDVTLMASGRNLAQLIGRAEAPGPDGPVPPSPIEAFGGEVGASNGWAVGGDVTASGRGMVLANPHFPWYGEAKFWECHLRIPGTYDVYGASLLGTPAVQIGFNHSLGWTHTFSRGHRFTLARLDLVGGSPTTYRYGDTERPMTSEAHTVEVLGADGGIDSVNRTLWRSHLGPMLNMPLLGWGLDTGFTFRDANSDNHMVIEQFVRMGQAGTVGEMRKVFHEVKGLPWVNTLAADSNGDAWFTDASATPRFTADAQERFVARNNNDMVAALLYQNRIALIDGSHPGDEWQDHPDARSPGLEPPGALPELHSRGVVLNANDSHWMNAPDTALTGYSVMGGLEGTPRSLRTRQNLRLAAAMTAAGDATLDDLQAMVLNNESLSGELLVESVIERCSGVGCVVVDGYEADLDAATSVLRDWDRRFDLDSVGAPLWREFMGGFTEAAWIDAGALFAEPFDPEHPLHTPAGLVSASRSGDDPVVLALGHAVRVLAEAGVAMDAALGDVQWVDRAGVRMPTSGGGECDGLLNVMVPVGALPPASLEPLPTPLAPIAGRATTGLGVGGYQVTYGTSFLMVVELGSDGPVARGVLVYGESGDARSVHHRDGAEAFARKELRPLLFDEADIAADPELRRFTLES